MPSRRTSIDPGELDRYIEILARPEAESVDSGGAPADEAPTTDWQILAQRVPALKEDLRGNERFVASQLSSPYDSRWTIHYRRDMDPDELNVPKLRRLRFKGREYDIVAARHLGRREGVELDTLTRA